MLTWLVIWMLALAGLYKWKKCLANEVVLGGLVWLGLTLTLLAISFVGRMIIGE